MEAASAQPAEHRHEKEGRITVVALDQSERSLYALNWALQTIKFGESDKLFLLHAKSSPTRAVGFGDSGYILSNEVIISMERAQEREINAFMSKALELCKEKQVNVETHVVLGDPRDVICEEVEKLHADILVIGSHGYGAVKRTFLGSVSDYCAHHGKCPVVIVKKPSKKSDQGKH